MSGEQEDSRPEGARAGQQVGATSAGQQTGGARGARRERSRGPRGRTPSELLARKQQLLAGAPAGPAEPDQRAEPDEADPLGARLGALGKLLQSYQPEGAGPSPAQAPASGARSIDDVYILLAKKEQDLQLAAELGKVLLERNDELSKANERIAEEYSHKLEVSMLAFVVVTVVGGVLFATHRRLLACPLRLAS